MSDQPWLRQVEVLIGPLPEWQGGGNEKKAINIFGDGTLNGLRLSFQVHKHIISTARPSTVDIYNLGPGLRQSIAAANKAQAQIILKAGWQNTGLMTICKGAVLSAVPQRRDTDIVMTVSFLAGYGGTERNIVSQKWQGGTELKNVIEMIATGLDGVVVDPKLIQVKKVNIPSRGLSFAGLASEILTTLGRTYGFSWRINDGVFEAQDDKEPFTGRVVVVGSKNGLLRAEPMLCSPFQMQAGVSIQSLFNPAIQPGKGVKLESVINPSLNGIYCVDTLSHIGDTHSSQWTTSIESWRKVA